MAPDERQTSGLRGSAFDVMLQRIRAQFFEVVGKAEEAVAPSATAEHIAMHWLKQVEKDGDASASDRQLIALHVARYMEEADLIGRGCISMEEWVHFALLSTASFARIQLRSMIVKSLKDNPKVLQELQGVFEAAKPDDDGTICFDSAVHQFALRIVERRKPRRSIEEAEETARKSLLSLGLKGTERLNYNEFIAHGLGRVRNEVQVYMYDLSRGKARTMSPWLIGRQVDAVWHTSAVVFNKEYYYAQDTVFAPPGETSFGDPDRKVHLGYTLWTMEELHFHVTTELKPIFQRDTYDVVCNNCNHFTDRVCLFLCGLRAPEEVRRQPEILLESKSVQAVRPLLNWWLRDMVVARDAGTSFPLQYRRFNQSEHLYAGRVVGLHSSSGLFAPFLVQVSSEPLKGAGRGGDGNDDSQGSSLFCACSVNNCNSGVSITPISSSYVPFEERSNPCEGSSCVGLQLFSGNKVCVQFLQVELDPEKGRLHAKVCSEMVVGGNLSPMSLDVKGEAVYLRVMQCMTNCEATRGSAAGALPFNIEITRPMLQGLPVPRLEPRAQDTDDEIRFDL